MEEVTQAPTGNGKDTTIILLEQLVEMVAGLTEKVEELEEHILEMNLDRSDGFQLES